MSGFRHGLVIGKFYPPHAGHHMLVRAAAARCERVTVVVMASSVESIPLDARVAWMREEHAREPHVHITGVMDEHRVDYDDDAVWRAHVELMLQGVRQAGGGPIDGVFTSESYGAELGRRLGAEHVPVDLLRRKAPVSGTMVRRDPVSTWQYLTAPVRAHLVRRVVIVGAESTGKTTMAAELAADLRTRGGAFAGTVWVEEYGRELTAELLLRSGARTMEELVWRSSDFERIAGEQNRREDAAAGGGGPVLLCDTDAFATGIWHERYVGRRSPAVEAQARQHPLYLLTHPDDVPFTQDGLRDGEHIREWMTGAFVERLRASGRNWRWLRGDRSRRRAAALAAIDALLAAGWGLREPLG